ncbi:MAG: hypothetical protein DSY42_04590 [Aquifex sp.]|nr:MAG: hypothetical protein DSY42_04590 [Aquifex sp.]
MEKGKLIIEHINAQSIQSNFDEIKMCVYSRDIDVLCVSETWLQTNTPDVYVNIPNYVLYRNDVGRGGGVCIYVKKELRTNIINFLLPKQVGVEDLWLSVQSNMYPAVIIGCVYRHPKANVDSFEYLQDVFRQLCVSKKNFYILGDFNNDLLLNSSKFNGILKNNRLVQLIDVPTRVTATSATLLDLIITNNPDLILAKVVVPNLISDHDLIGIKINITKPRRQPLIKTFRQLRNYNKDILSNLIMSEYHSFNKILDTDNVNRQVYIFNENFIKCLDICAPVETKEIKRPYTPWFTDELRDAISKKNAIHNDLKRDRANILLLEQYKNIKKQVKSLIQSTKKDYYLKELINNKNNSTDKWNIIKEIIPNPKNSSEDYVFSDKEAKAEEFNTFFANIGKNTFEITQKCLLNNDLTCQELSSHDYDNKGDIFRPQSVNVETVILTIKSLNKTRSVGCDGISLNFIRDSLYMIAFYLTVIVNTSLTTGVFPETWKHAMVIPFFKKGDQENVSNYRPISLLPILSKIVEKIVSNQLLDFLLKNNLLSNSQHGFRPNLSTESALLKITDAIYRNMDNKMISLLTLCDLSKAFDSVSHSILLKKCAILNIDAFWLNSYLKNRTQSVKLDKTLSSKASVQFGVPQGSILGPILFNIYVNDMKDYISDCTLVQYADDTQLLHQGHLEKLNEIIHQTEETLKKIKTYFSKNGLMVNATKTQCIFIGSRQLCSHIPEDVVVKFDGTNISPSIHIKNLGLHMDRYMSFDAHINEISKKVMGMLIYINRISSYLDKKSRIIVVQSLVLSHINYCLSIWGTTTSSLINKVQKLQNFAARVAVGGIKKFDHVSPAYKELKWLKIKQKHTYDICCAMFKVINNVYPDWLYSFLTVHDSTASVTRQQNNLVVPYSKTETGARAFTVTGPKTWNSLPFNITSTTSHASFKSKLRNFILNDLNRA